MTVANTDLSFSSKAACMGSPATVDCFTSHGRGAVDIPMSYDQLVGLLTG